MKKTLQPLAHPLKATVSIPGSKSISNRALLLAALAEGESELRKVQVSEDLQHLKAALKALGVSLREEEDGRSLFVKGCKGNFPERQAKLHCGESGTLARFLLLTCAAASGEYTLDAAPGLRKRPFSSVFQLLKSQGIKLSDEHFPLTLRSTEGLPGGELQVDASESGQVVSALLLTAPFAKQATRLKVDNLVSRSYVDLTCAVMADFGVDVDCREGQDFFVSSKQTYQARSYTIEPDCSTAAYFFGAAAITGGEVTVPGLSRNSKQGDIVFLSLLEQMGCKVSESSEGIRVKGPAQLKGLEANLNATPDLFMTLAALAPFAQTPTLITGIGHARHKESDRLSALRQGFQALNITCEEGPNWFKVHPSQPTPGLIHSQNDHRISMAFSLLSLRLPLEIEGAEAISKSCPDFFTLWSTL